MRTLPEWINIVAVKLLAQWKAYPVKTQRLYVLYGFLFYLAITITVLLQISLRPGLTRRPLPIEHIHSPPALRGAPLKQMNDSLANSTKKTIMKKNKNDDKTAVRITDGTPADPENELTDQPGVRSDKWRKPVIFCLMGIVFLGCLYLIFGSQHGAKKGQSTGINGSVPQATDTILEQDKQKAYENEIAKERQAEKKKNLSSLADFWTMDRSDTVQPEMAKDSQETVQAVHDSAGHRPKTAVNSYKDAQRTLGTFYRGNNDETGELKRQISTLKDQLDERQQTTHHAIDEQLELMEKSYQMAARYLPIGPGRTQEQTSSDSAGTDSGHHIASGRQSQAFTAFAAVEFDPVSALQQSTADTGTSASIIRQLSHGFLTPTSDRIIQRQGNSVLACVQETQKITGEGIVRIRLLEPARIAAQIIPAGTVLTAYAKLQQGRLQLKVSSIEAAGNIYPVDINVYDLDGQPGLAVPYSSEMNALTEMASNMSQTAGTSVMFTQSAGQQIAADLSRGVVQGVSGYFSKKLRLPKVILKADHRLLLVSKN